MTPLRRKIAATCWPLVVTTSLACLVGCASGDVRPKAVELPEAVAVSRVWTASPVIENRRALGDAASNVSTLNSGEVLAAALAFNPRMKLARAQDDLGAAGVLIARERANPTLSLSPEHLIQAVSGVSPWVVAVSIVWPMRTAGKRRLAIEQALAADDAATMNSAAIVWSLRADARAAVCGVEFAWAHRELADTEAALRADLVSRLEKQSDAGLVSRYEVARARLDRDASTQRLGQADAAVIAARHDVASLAGLPMSEIELRSPGVDCVSSIGTGEPPPASELESRAIGSRLDLRAKLAEFRGADAAWRTEFARRVPNLAAGPGYIYDQGVRKVTFSLSFELPIHSHNAGNIARARADRDRVVAEAEILQASIFADVEKSSDQYLQARRQLALTKSLRAEAEAILDRDLERERAGELDRPAVLVSRIGTLSARADELTAARLVFDAQTALETATQSPLSTPGLDADMAISLLESP